MGMVIVISLPLILFCIALGIGCYILGRAKGRQDMKNNAQVFGVPTPPPGSDSTPADADASLHPSQPFKPHNFNNV